MIAKCCFACRTAADLGHTEAQYNCAVCLLNGLGTRKAPQDAIPYFKLAADKQYLPSLYNLAMCYIQGVGTVNGTV